MQRSAAAVGIDSNYVTTAKLQQRSQAKRFRSLVSIQGPEGYGPSTLPLRHSEDDLNLSAATKLAFINPKK